MSEHRRRPARQGTRNGRVTHRRADHRRRLLAGTAVAAAAAVGLAVALWTSDGDAGWRGQDGALARRTATPPSAYPLSSAPQTIPAVRAHTPEHGPGWRPSSGGRVLVNDGSVSDEGRLVADELHLRYAGESNDVRAGDVHLTVHPDTAANPESYTMTVRGGRVEISAPQDTGVFYGTRTLKQAVAAGGTAPEGVVHDEPAKPQRGLMLDIARKFYDASWIEDRIRELGDLKYNELGLHFSDDQGFRIESTTHPEVVSPQHLTQAEVRRIQDLAASRHIKIVPEIDSPGHLGAVLDHHPDLRLVDAQGRVVQGAIDISKPQSARLVDDLLNEFSGLFDKSDQWHLGGDEYQALTYSDPEASFPQLATAAQNTYGSGATVKDLTTGWLNDRAATVRGHAKVPRAWNDGFFTGGRATAAEDIRVAYWTGREIGARPPVSYLDEGRKMLNYNDEFLYYVLGQPQNFTYPSGQRIYERWTPLVLRGTTPVPARYDGQILGGSFAVWGDRPQAQTQAQVAQGIRMPLRATIQKLWDPGTPSLTWDRFRQLADRLG